MAEKKRMMNSGREPIFFTTDSGAEVRLIWEKVEYRAYKKDGGGWRDLRLGAALPDRLVEHVKRRF